MSASNEVALLSLAGIVLSSLIFSVGILSDAHWLSGLGMILLPAAMLFGLLAYSGRRAAR